MVVGCDDGSLHGLKIAQGGGSVQHVWTNEPSGAAVLAIDFSSNKKVKTGVSISIRNLHVGDMSMKSR